MQTITHKNEMTKRRFFKYLRSGKRFSEKTIICHEKAIWVWEEFSGKAELTNFNITAVEKFKDWLENKKKRNNQESVSLSYRYDILRYLKTFFTWLSKQRGYKRIDPIAIDYLNLPRGEAKIATQRKEVKTPTLKEVEALIDSIKVGSEVDMRDRAMISLFALTGARISAIRTLSMKCFDREGLILYQDPALGVETKFSTRIVTPLVSVFLEESLNCFLEWFDYLQKEKNFKPNNPIFPMTKIESGGECLGYRNTGQVEPEFWRSSSSLRNRIKQRFVEAGIKYYHPHTLRHWFVKKTMELSLTEEQKKAISQSLGHKDMRVTFGSCGYGRIKEDRQIELVRGINSGCGKPEVSPFLDDATLERFAEKVSDKLRQSKN